jgi:hypothetical protein
MLFVKLAVMHSLFLTLLITLSVSGLWPDWEIPIQSEFLSDSFDSYIEEIEGPKETTGTPSWISNKYFRNVAA